MCDTARARKIALILWRPGERFQDTQRDTSSGLRVSSQILTPSERSYGEGLASACNRELCMFRMRQCPPVRRHVAVPCPALCSFRDSIV